LPCYEHIALEDREVVVVFEGDVTVKLEGQLALERRVAFLWGRGARPPEAYLPDSSKTRVADYLASEAGGTMAELRLLVCPYKA
jgi:hypothetical protein